MLAAVKNRLFTNWHTMRWVALGFGLILGINWIMNSGTISGFLALFFTFQAITNTGCLAGQCTPVQRETSDFDSSEPIDYTEIK